MKQMVGRLLGVGGGAANVAQALPPSVDEPVIPGSMPEDGVGDSDASFIVFSALFPLPVLSRPVRSFRSAPLALAMRRETMAPQ